MSAMDKAAAASPNPQRPQSRPSPGPFAAGHRREKVADGFRLRGGIMGVDRVTDSTRGGPVATIRTSRAAGVLTRLLTEISPDVERTDGELVRAFLDRKCQAAFAELVRRHGPMVLGVCLRVLRHEQDAEDAFQAAFLVLARKAASVVPREAIGGWLHGVACRTALGARARRSRHEAREKPVGDVPEQSATELGRIWDELAPLLDRELSRLPEKYRLAVVLCELEGRPRKEVARQLGVPEGTLSSRLATARKMLAQRLSRCGVGLSVVSLAAGLGHGAARATVPECLAVSTVEAASDFATGCVAAGAVRPGAAALIEGVMKAMLLGKIKVATATLVAILLVAGV